MMKSNHVKLNHALSCLCGQIFSLCRFPLKAGLFLEKLDLLAKPWNWNWVAGDVDKGRVQIFALWRRL